MLMVDFEMTGKSRSAIEGSSVDISRTALCSNTSHIKNMMVVVVKRFTVLQVAIIKAP